MKNNSKMSMLPLGLGHNKVPLHTAIAHVGKLHGLPEKQAMTSAILTHAGVNNPQVIINSPKPRG